MDSLQSIVTFMPKATLDAVGGGPPWLNCGDGIGRRC